MNHPDPFFDAEIEKDRFRRKFNPRGIAFTFMRDIRDIAVETPGMSFTLPMTEEHEQLPTANDQIEWMKFQLRSLFDRSNMEVTILPEEHAFRITLTGKAEEQFRELRSGVLTSIVDARRGVDKAFAPAEVLKTIAGFADTTTVMRHSHEEVSGSFKVPEGAIEKMQSQLQAYLDPEAKNLLTFRNVKGGFAAVFRGEAAERFHAAYKAQQKRDRT